MTDDEFLALWNRVMPRIVLPSGETILQAIEDRQRLRNEVSAFVVQTNSASKRVVDLLEGPEYTRLDGTTDRHREEGMVYKVDELSNGGLKLRLPAAAWVAIIVAIIAGVAQVVSAVLQ